MVVLLPLYLWSGRAERLTRSMSVALMALGVLALAMHATGLSAQDNLAIIGFALPPALAIAVVTARPRVIAGREVGKSTRARQSEQARRGATRRPIAAGKR